MIASLLDRQITYGLDSIRCDDDIDGGSDGRLKLICLLDGENGCYNSGYYNSGAGRLRTFLGILDPSGVLPEPTVLTSVQQFMEPGVDLGPQPWRQRPQVASNQGCRHRHQSVQLKHRRDT